MISSVLWHTRVRTSAGLAEYEAQRHGIMASQVDIVMAGEKWYNGE